MTAKKIQEKLIDIIKLKLQRHVRPRKSLIADIRELTIQNEDLRKRINKKETLLRITEKENQEKNNRINALETFLEQAKNELAAQGKESALQIEKLRNSNLQLNYNLQRIRQSVNWKKLNSQQELQGRYTRKLNVEALPLHDLIASKTGWEVAGADPQFLLVTERAWHELSGWCYMEIDIKSESSLLSELFFFDEKRGFDTENVIRFQLNGSDVRRIPLYIPSDCQAIRFDPHNEPTNFELKTIELLQLENPPVLEPDFIEQVIVYKDLGFREGNVLGLTPCNQIQRHNGSDFCWSSEGEDPYFAVKGMENCLEPGWCLISLSIRTNVMHGIAQIYFDYGKGYSEENSIILPFNNDETASRFYCLSEAPKKIRLDPIDCVARFSVKKLEFQSWNADAAYLEICRQMSEKCPEYLGQDPGAILASLREFANKEQKDLQSVVTSQYQTLYPEKRMLDNVNYADWILDNEQNSEAWKKALKEMLSLQFQPCISILLPVYNVSEKYLRKTLNSVVNQSYPNWELCIADDASTNTHIRPLLERYAETDKRIKVTFRRENGHISAASNSALQLAAGEYIALLDHDDELANDALFWVVEALNRNPSARLLYSDEDKIDKEGRRSDPHFKSGWNPDMFFSQNYISHLGVYRHELITKVGGFRIGVEGSQDHDLILRCLPYLNYEEIVHIPKVLYHWRSIEGSTAKNAEQKKYTSEAGIKALRDYFDSQGLEEVTVTDGLVPNTYRVIYPIPKTKPLVSLLIPTRDCVELLESCVRSIIDKTTYQNYEILIIDNGSIQSETLDFFETITKEDSRIQIVPFHLPFNYSAINNYGVEKASGEVVGLINNDIEVISPEWLEEMLSHAIRPEIGCVGAKLYYGDDTIQHSGVIVGIGGVAGHSHKHFPRMDSGYFSRLKIVQNLSAVTAACLLVRKSIYVQVGGLEENNLQVAFNDVDFCLKVRMAGFRNLWTPYAELYHYESKSRGYDDTPERAKRFMNEVNFIRNKWGDELLKNDPYYNPNLTLIREDFSLK